MQRCVYYESIGHHIPTVSGGKREGKYSSTCWCVKRTHETVVVLDGYTFDFES